MPQRHFYAAVFAVCITLSLMMLALQHIRPTVLRGIALAFGVAFVLLAAGIRVLHDCQPGESALVLLVPFGIGSYLLLTGVFLKNVALRRAIVLLFVIAGPGMAFVFWGGCALKIFSNSFCA